MNRLFTLFSHQKINGPLYIVGGICVEQEWVMKNRKTYEIGEIRDLSDFHIKWRYFRGSVQDLLVDESPVSESQKKVLTWLIELADRVEDADLK